MRCCRPSCAGHGALSRPGGVVRRLDRLYGASVDYTVRKQGENQCVGFVASFIDDSYIPGGEQLLEPVAELLGELLCDPVTERGRFVTAYFEGEKTNLIDAIRSQVNDKREYAYARLLREMCDGEPYGISRLGDEAGAGEAADAKAPRPVRRAACHRQAGAVLLRQRIPGAGTGGVGRSFRHAAQGWDPGHRSVHAPIRLGPR